ncbi:MAG: hypothetical protein JWP31_1818 [Aeromicrobium sp.]|nr:hypothetical protein [Aeromicrobium sp.]
MKGLLVTSQPCSCWSEVSLHSGHCCFSDENCPWDGPDTRPLCGHYDAGMETLRAKPDSPTTEGARP